MLLHLQFNEMNIMFSAPHSFKYTVKEEKMLTIYLRISIINDVAVI